MFVVVPVLNELVVTTGSAWSSLDPSLARQHERCRAAGVLGRGGPGRPGVRGEGHAAVRPVEGAPLEDAGEARPAEAKAEAGAAEAQSLAAATGEYYPGVREHPGCPLKWQDPQQVWCSSGVVVV